MGDWPSSIPAYPAFQKQFLGLVCGCFMSNLAFYNPTLWTGEFPCLAGLQVTKVYLHHHNDHAYDLMAQRHETWLLGHLRRVTEGDGQTTPMRIPGKWAGRTLSASRICFLCSTSWTSNNLVTSIPFCSAPNRECSSKYMFQGCELGCELVIPYTHLPSPPLPHPDAVLEQWPEVLVNCHPRRQLHLPIRTHHGPPGRPAFSQGENCT